MTNINLKIKHECEEALLIITPVCLLLLLVLGIIYFLKDKTNKKNFLSCLEMNFLSITVVLVQWWAIGYSLSFSKKGNSFIGSLENIFFTNMDAFSSSSSKNTMFAINQGFIATISVTLIFDFKTERRQKIPTLFFIFAWTTLVYNPIVRWVWSPQGWIFQLGLLDFAGAIPIHVSSGTAALVYSLTVRKNEYKEKKLVRPKVFYDILFRVALIWFGLFGFSSKLPLSKNDYTVVSFITTNLIAISGGLIWVILENKTTFSTFCSGMAVNLIAISAIFGHIEVFTSIIFGIIVSFCCNFARRLKSILGHVNIPDIFIMHGIGGTVGSLLVGVFAQDIPYSNSKNWKQIENQMIGSISVMIYSFFMTFLIITAMNSIPNLSLSSEKKEKLKDRAKYGMTNRELSEDYSHQYRGPNYFDEIYSTSTAINVPTFNNNKYNEYYSKGHSKLEYLPA